MKGVIFTPKLTARLYAIGNINAAAALFVTNSVNNTVSKNTIINIKDWNFANKNTYKFLFNNKDYKGISYRFKNAKLILSHFTKEQSKKWIEEYKLKENKFIFETTVSERPF